MQNCVTGLHKTLEGKRYLPSAAYISYISREVELTSVPVIDREIEYIIPPDPDRWPIMPSWLPDMAVASWDVHLTMNND